MNKYKLYFEFMGKKMQYEICANSQYEAEELLREKILIHRTVILSGKEPEQEPMQDEMFNNIKDMFGMK